LARYRIFSIDGGAIGGVIPMALLERLGLAAGMPGHHSEALGRVRFALSQWMRERFARR
jgi:hypothetical protein